MRITEDLHEGRFARRLNRFAGEAFLGSRLVRVHIPHSGRLGELLVPGRRVVLRRKSGAQRKTGYDLLHVAGGRRWICIDARLPPRLVEEGLHAGKIVELKGLHPCRREIRLGDGRIDLLVAGAPGRCYVEAKAVTLVAGRTALFPDAPTERGRRHLLALLRARRRGSKAAVVFVVQRADALCFAPNWGTDPAFARTLVRVADAGVLMLAYACQVTRIDVTIMHSLPVLLNTGMR